MNWFPLRRFSLVRPAAIHLLRELCVIPVFLLLLTANSSAQYPNGGPDSSRSERIDLRGTVVNSVTGQAIARALVTVAGPETYSTLTGSDGGFTFEKIPADNMYLQARRPGFFDQSGAYVRPVAGKNVVVKLVPAGAIFGQVADENGEPIEEAQVRLLQQRVVMGKRRWVSSGEAPTNDQGQFRFANVRPGKYILAVGPSMMNILAPGRTGYANVFYPKAPDRASATPIDITAGQQAEANFELSPVPVFKISGVVAGPKTLGLNVSLVDSSGSEIALYARVDQATGEFEIRGVPRGTYVLRVQGFRQQEEPLAAHTAVVVVNSDISGIALVLHSPLRIPIDVRSNDSQLVGSSQQSVSPGVNIQALSSTDEQASGYANFEGPPQARRLVLHLPESGTYNLSITSNGNGYVQSATSGSTDLLSDPLVVPESGNINPIEVVLDSDGAQVRGVIRNASGPAIVIAVPDNENRQPAVSGGPQGQFTFQSLAPGDYSLYALRPTSDMDYSDRDSVGPFRSKGVHITLAPNQKADVTLDLIEADE